MADFFTQTVVTPAIPIADMTPIERLALELFFEGDDDGEAVYFTAPEGPRDYAFVERAEIEAALTAVTAVDADLAQFFRQVLDTPGVPHLHIDIDPEVLPYAAILQRIVQRSKSVDHVALWTAWTCSKMRPDGFGGALEMITASGSTFWSTQDQYRELVEKLHLAA